MHVISTDLPLPIYHQNIQITFSFPASLRQNIGHGNRTLLLNLYLSLSSTPRLPLFQTLTCTYGGAYFQFIQSLHVGANEKHTYT